MSSPDHPVSRKFVEGAMRLVEPAEGAEFIWAEAPRPSLLQRIFGRGENRRLYVQSEGAQA